MAQQFEPEVYRKVQQVIEEISEGAIAKLPGAVDVVRDQAKDAGLPVIIQNCDSLAEVGVPAIQKATNGLLDLCREYCKKAKEFFDAFGIEY